MPAKKKQSTEEQSRQEVAEQVVTPKQRYYFTAQNRSYEATDAQHAQEQLDADLKKEKTEKE